MIHKGTNSISTSNPIEDKFYRLWHAFLSHFKVMFIV